MSSNSVCQHTLIEQIRLLLHVHGHPIFFNHLSVYRPAWLHSMLPVLTEKHFFCMLGVIHLSTYLKNYKVGDIVDVKVVMK